MGFLYFTNFFEILILGLFYLAKNLKLNRLQEKLSFIIATKYNKHIQ